MKSILAIIGVISLAFLFPKAQPQPKSNLTPNMFNALIYKGTTVIQLNSEWNKSNEYKWVETPKAKYYKIDLDKDPIYKEKLQVKSLPTLIIYKEGKEVKRYEGGLHMKITTPIQIIQKDL
jgi:thiol-disulfide isomerase/thioredoxin